jgi:hypothetical protein
MPRRRQPGISVQAAPFAPKALDNSLVGLQSADQVSKADLVRWLGRQNATTGASHRAGDAERCQILHNLAEIMTG